MPQNNNLALRTTATKRIVSYHLMDFGFGNRPVSIFPKRTALTEASREGQR